MVATTSHRNGVALSSLDLDSATFGCTGVVTFRGTRKQFKTVSIGGQDFADASDKVSVKREGSTRKMAFQLLNDSVQALNQFGNVRGRVSHVDRVRGLAAT
jgi:hypothetical protein